MTGFLSCGLGRSCEAARVRGVRVGKNSHARAERVDPNQASAEAWPCTKG